MNPMPIPLLDYASPGMTPTARGGMKILGWIFFVALAVILFFIFNSRNNSVVAIPLSELRDQLSNGNIETVVIDGDTVYGTFRMLTSPNAGTGLAITKFRSELTPGLGASWNFVHWILDNKQGASVRVETSGGDLKTLIIPMIPWLAVAFIFWLIVAKAKRDKAMVIQKPRPVINVVDAEAQP